MRTELSAREKIDRESDKGDSHTEGLVRVCGGLRMWLLHHSAMATFTSITKKDSIKMIIDFRGLINNLSI